MRFLIVGVGAIGTVFLAFLSRAGHDTVGLTKKGKVLSFARVRGIWGSFDTPVSTVDDVGQVRWEPDIVIISVKSYDTESALEAVKPVVGPKTLVMIAQNGYGNYEKAVETFGKGKVLLARVIFGSRLVDRGYAEITVSGDDMVIGDPAGIVDTTFLEKLARIFTDAGIPTRHEREVYKYLWDKIVYNCALNPLGALLEVNYGTLAQNPHTRALMDRIIEEAFNVGRNLEIPSFWNSSEEFKEVFYGRLIPPTAGHYPSMLADIRRGRTEIDALNGAICRLGKRAGVPTPVNEIITELTKAKEFINREAQAR